MAHINSYSKGSKGKHFLFTKGPKGKEIQIGGPYPSAKFATKASKDASRVVGERPVAAYIDYLAQRARGTKAMTDESMTGQLTWEKIPFPTPPIPRHKPPKPKRKGGNVKGYITGDLINPVGGKLPGTPQGAGIGKVVAPQKKPPNPLAAQDALLKKKADQKKRIDLAGKPGTPQAPPKPGMPQAPGMAQKPPRALARKGGKMRKGDAVKSYSNICRSPVPRA